MKLILDDNYRVETDSYQFILREKNVVKDPESPNFGIEQWEPVAYYATLEGILKGWARRLMLDSDVETFSELKDLLRALDEKIENFMND